MSALVTSELFVRGTIQRCLGLAKGWDATASQLSGAPMVEATAVRKIVSLVKNDFLMRSLGRPHRDQVVTTRPAELTTLQAIDLANGEILAGYLQRGAKQLTGEGDLGTWLYRHALSRPPTTGEKAVLAEVLGEKPDAVAVEDLLWLVFMHPEFQMIR